MFSWKIGQTCLNILADSKNLDNKYKIVTGQRDS